jgi:hypothetical protein
VRDVCDLRRKSFDVLRLLHEQPLGDEEREVGVHVARRLEAPIEGLLDELPDRIGVRPDHHAALHGRVVGQLRAPDDVQVPLIEILRARCDLGDELVRLVGGFLVFGHQGRHSK